MSQRVGGRLRCTRCSGQAQLHLCWNCGKAVRQVLIGLTIRDRDGRIVDVEPGMVWYLDRLAPSLSLRLLEALHARVRKDLV